MLLCHCPPRGVNDDPDDPAHIGWEALRDWVLEHRPRWLLHGHVHPRPGTLLDHIGGTKVVYVNGAKVLNLNVVRATAQLSDKLARWFASPPLTRLNGRCPRPRPNRCHRPRGARSPA